MCITDLYITSYDNRGNAVSEIEFTVPDEFLSGFLKNRGMTLEGFEPSSDICEEIYRAAQSAGCVLFQRDVPEDELVP